MPNTDFSLLSTPEVHFTYEKCPDMKSLCQGDLLSKTEDLCNVLEEVHPYFLRDAYTHFIVLTQSCDLVRRHDKDCKSPYITLAAVREYEEFLEGLFIKRQYVELVRGVPLLDEKKKRQVLELIERIYNNTEDDYFFLYKHPTAGLLTPQVACLKVSIALKSELHYETCLAAKRLELNDAFKAKLGWLVGSMYSKVGTVDWSSIMDDKSRKKMIDNDLTSICVACSKEQKQVLKERLEADSNCETRESIMEMLSNIKIQTKHEKAISFIEKIFRSNCHDIATEDKEKLLTAIKNSKQLEQLIR